MPRRKRGKLTLLEEHMASAILRKNKKKGMKKSQAIAIARAQLKKIGALKKTKKGLVLTAKGKKLLAKHSKERKRVKF